MEVQLEGDCEPSHILLGNLWLGSKHADQLKRSQCFGSRIKSNASRGGLLFQSSEGICFFYCIDVVVVVVVVLIV
ncbi:hypothetical protein V2J09_017629 [Rumex salicifolius]